MTSIAIVLPEDMTLAIPDETYGNGFRVNPYAVAEALKQAVGELARYALSEAILYPPR